jgi:excisionase family DNA binding protein
MPQPPPLSVAEASEQTGIPKRTIQHAITQGELKAHKLSGATGSYLIQRVDLDRWATRREAATA